MPSIVSLAVRGLTVAFGPNVVLDDVTFTIAPGERAGVTGPNGIGKSTLLRAVAGVQPIDRGTVALSAPSANVGYLPQEAERRAGEDLRAFVHRRTGVAAAIAELDASAAALGSGEAGADDRYSTALDRYLALGAADLDARIAETCQAVGLGEQLLDVPMTGLSGGQAARAGLATLLLSRFDLYLLDEPTNDLDFQGLEQLEQFVTSSSAGVLMVSHDRAFLQRCATSVIEIDEVSRAARVYGGGWDAYLEERVLARRHAEEAYAVNQAQRKALQERAQVQRQWSDAGVRKVKRSDESDKFIRHHRSATSEKQASKAAATQRALERLDRVDKPWEGWELHLEFALAERSGDDVASLRGAVVEQGAFRLGPVDVAVHWADRIAITGANGAGKSTLLRALMGRAPLVKGEQHLGRGVIVGELDQARVLLDDGSSLLDAFVARTGVLAQEARSVLAKFGLAADHVARPTASLSPGERTRATLAILMAQGTNLLVLDEPTNHLDLPAIEQLEQALGAFTGTVLLITHDRRFLESASISRTLEVVAEGRASTVRERR